MKENKKLSKGKDKIKNYKIFYEFLILGLISFGGPIAHISFFRQTFVKNKKWIDEKRFIDIVSFSNFLPGPSSTQVGMCIGFLKNGISGSFFAWLGFTLPSAIIMILFAVGYLHFNEYIADGFLKGIKIVVVIVVIQALVGMSRQYITNTKTIFIASITVIITILSEFKSYHFFSLILSGILGLIFFKDDEIMPLMPQVKFRIEYKYLIFILTFIILFLGLPFLQNLLEIKYLEIADKFFRTGSLVFGGGHVVLPLLQNEVLNSNLIDEETFIFGYGLAQAIPGPLFTFSGFLGASFDIGTNNVFTGILCLIMIFMPSHLLVLGLIPYWEFLRSKPQVRRCLIGINSCVVGLLIATFINPILIYTLIDLKDFILLIVALIIIFLLKFPQWLSVLIMGLVGFSLNLYT